MNSGSNFRVLIRCFACFMLVAFLSAGCATAPTKAPITRVTPPKGTVVAKFTLEAPQDPAGVDRTMATLTEMGTKKMEELGCYGCSLFIVGMTIETYYPADSQAPQQKAVVTFEARQ